MLANSNRIVFCTRAAEDKRELTPYHTFSIQYKSAFAELVERHNSGTRSVLGSRCGRVTPNWMPVVLGQFYMKTLFRWGLGFYFPFRAFACFFFALLDLQFLFLGFLWNPPAWTWKTQEKKKRINTCRRPHWVPSCQLRTGICDYSLR